MSEENTDEKKEEREEKTDTHKEENTETHKEHVEKKPEYEKEFQETFEKKRKPYVFAAVIVIAFVVGYFVTPTITGFMTASPSQIGNKMVSFVNENLIPGGGVTLVSVETMSDLYVITVSFEGNDMPLYATKDGKFLILGNVVDTTQPIPDQGPINTSTVKSDIPENTDIKTFLDSGEEICSVDGKPIIRMYSFSECDFCAWTKPIFEKVVGEYVEAGKVTAYLWEDNFNIMSEDLEEISEEEVLLYQKYGLDGVPAFIFGCKYYRSGAPFINEENGETMEEDEFRAVIEDLIGE
ncbi:MAG: hypothetical protein ISS36_00860 [Candidatus Aenigmarchaeota archaeon]|nr:hypothetical protein [Candidatus Aenigmarchaeota archaeon]